MGTWGTGLYQDDVAQDVRYLYKDLLHRGKTGEEATKELLESFQPESNDTDDASAFWFALADTQWNVGRLQEDVKRAALRYIDEGSDLKRWEESGLSILKKRRIVLDRLKQKLLSPQPAIKIMKPYYLFRCPWKLGDVFAYKLSDAYTENTAFEGKYLFFVKVGEDKWSIGHIIPIVYVYWTVSDRLLSIDELEAVNYIPQFYVPEAYITKKVTSIQYRLSMISTSSRSIPKKALTYIGNAGLKEPLEYSSVFSTFRTWKEFEEYMINDFQAWDGYQMLTDNLSF